MLKSCFIRKFEWTTIYNIIIRLKKNNIFFPNKPIFFQINPYFFNKSSILIILPMIYEIGQGTEGQCFLLSISYF